MIILLQLEAKGKPVDFKEMLGMEPDGGATKIRDIKSKHRKRWFGPEQGCLAPHSTFRPRSAAPSSPK